MRRITRGDAQAVFNAFENGGLAILIHSKEAKGAPADHFGSHGSIRPFAGSEWDGRHFCADDWHVILIAAIDDVSRKRQDTEAIASQITVRFVLDGTELSTKRTPVKALLGGEPFGREGFYFQEGRIMSPDDLAVGVHTLRGQMTEASEVIHDETITFEIDASGTGACR